MKKMFLAVFFVAVATTTFAQGKNCAEFSKLYKQTVEKMKAGKITSAKFDTKDSSIGVVEITYKKNHPCLCKSKECHGPRIMINVSSKNTTLSIFPSGHHFGDVDHSVPGVDIVEVPMETINKEEAFAETATKTIMLAYNKQ